MTAQPIEEDGNLPAALNNLGEAVSALVDDKPESVKLVDEEGEETGETRICWTSSLYEQLVGEVPGSQGGGTSHVPGSTPPLCLDAAELKAEIDTAVAAWEPRPHIVEDEYMTVIRLRAIETRKWRPQDVAGIDQITGNLQAWCERIRGILNPTPKWHLPNPCPACETAVVYRTNSAGERVRQPALQIGATGCVCQNCHHEWAPAYFQLLAATLGYDLPEGVLE